MNYFTDNQSLAASWVLFIWFLKNLNSVNYFYCLDKLVQFSLKNKETICQIITFKPFVSFFLNMRNNTHHEILLFNYSRN